MGETTRHLELKRAAGRWLATQGVTHHAEEVACPIHRYRIDVAGVIGRVATGADLGARLPLFDGAGPVQPVGESIVIECKQERADFLRDSGDHAHLLRTRTRLLETRDRLQAEWIRPREPWLCRQRSLFPDDDTAWDYAGSGLPAYAAVQEELVRLDAAIRQATKLATFVRYRLADRLYIAAPVGLLKRRDLPPGWGLLEAIGPMDQWELRESIPAPATRSPLRFRARLAKRISHNRRVRTATR